MLTHSFFCHCTYTEGTYNRQLKNVPDFRDSTYGRKYYHFFNKTSQVPIFENYALLITKFLVIIWNYGKK